MEKEAETLFKKIMSENFPNLREIWTFKFMKLLDHFITSIHNDLLQDSL